MPSKYYNPFQGLDVRVPNRFRDEFGRYCQTHSEDRGRSSPVHNPFPRMIDMWFLAVFLGAQEGKPADYDSKDSYRIIDASIFSSDPWRIDALISLVRGYTNDIEIANRPREVLALASGFAVAGMDKLLIMVKEGDSELAWNLSDELDRFLKKLYLSSNKV